MYEHLKNYPEIRDLDKSLNFLRDEGYRLVLVLGAQGKTLTFALWREGKIVDEILLNPKRPESVLKFVGEVRKRKVMKAISANLGKSHCKYNEHKEVKCMSDENMSKEQNRNASGQYCFNPDFTLMPLKPLNKEETGSYRPGDEDYSYLIHMGP